ncbi:ferritin family protein [Rhodococcus artemisiae]|uniref:propane 2-monooxygenase n=1 Tax=Rhodococcus artemisiae TaxID=714159 RepID=A0ABU7LIY7_9NOCA|nr:monooxygenase [Rhodococcus artemisiae]MEE2061532.1 monooxygenase [Rhodococcus artemisiae]
MALNLTDRHEKIKSFDWEPNYFPKDAKYGTKYKIPPKTKDPFRTLISDYVKMEEEKDDRAYGSFEGLLSRLNNSAQAQPRFMEVMKPLMSIAPYAEYSGVKLCSMLVDTFENPELRQGYFAQMIDEVRHTNQQAYLQRYFAKNAPDPAGFNHGFRIRSQNPFGRAGRATFETFTNGDPITNAIHLLVGESAYTNSLFVAATELAAANGDQTTPSIFLSIQSDESRHIANGYTTLSAALSNPDNIEMAQDDFDKAFWRMHQFFDNFLGIFYDYYGKVRLKPYQHYWQQWVWEDFVGNYVEKLAPFGLEVPSCATNVKHDVESGAGHTAGMLSAALWPVHPWRSDFMDDADVEFLANSDPNWEEHFGQFWRDFREMGDPKNAYLPLDQFEQMPNICRVCQMPCVFPRIDITEPRYFVDQTGRRHAICSGPCERIFIDEPHRYQGETWFEINDGLSLAEYIERNGLLRSDGKTLIGQPHLLTDERWLWTIDDIRRNGFVIHDPLPDVPAEDLRPIFVPGLDPVSV